MLRMADRDIAAFTVLRQAAGIHPSIICFHAQQAIEKCFKAVLFYHRIEFGRTHDLVLLRAILDQHQIASSLSADQLASLSPCAVMLRYDEIEVEATMLDPQDLEEMVVAARRWAGDCLKDAVG